ncbi:MAG: YceI family protein [Pseudomonadota bacterium]
MLRAAFVGFLLSVGLACTAQAGTEWQVDPTQSEVGFEYLKDGAPTKGEFRDFAGGGTFDAAAPQNARFELRIRSKSIDLYDGLASAFATSAEWFDSKNHPEVIYVLQALEPLDGDRYTATGQITIRGEKKPLISEIALKIGADSANASGTLTITRADFLLGIGPSAAFVEIGPDVLVTFALTAKPDG